MEFNSSLSADRNKTIDNDDSIINVHEDIPRPFDEEEVRRCRLTYLSRGNQTCSNVISSAPIQDISDAALSMADLPENLEPPSAADATDLTDAKVLKVHRSNICKGMVDHFQDETVTTHLITFEIIDDHGKPEAGVGFGVTRDVFSLFWKSFGDSMTVGEREGALRST